MRLCWSIVPKDAANVQEIKANDPYEENAERISMRGGYLVCCVVLGSFVRATAGL